jgi:ZIP family zinc transporter
VVTNGGPSPVTIAQVLIDEAYWDYTSSYDGPIERLKSTTLTIPYPWVEGEPVNITLVTSTGVTFDHSIEVATATPAVDGRFLLTFALLGIYIGLIPVLLGMTWKPFLGGLSDKWLNFFMAFTAGVLIFLGVETLGDALEQANSLPSALGGVGVVAAGAIGAFAIILVLSRRFRRRPGTDALVVTAFTVAFGIGIHNLGEGLAVGAAYRLGEIALGAFLVIGFAIHNTTEGLGIVSILGDRKTSLMVLSALGVIAGLPTVAGAWAGAFFFSPTLAAIFLAIATGAIAEVVFDVMGVVKKRSPAGLGSAESLSGIAVGLAVMYLTGLLVAA